jgi:hypothetical protein
MQFTFSLMKIHQNWTKVVQKAKIYTSAELRIALFKVEKTRKNILPNTFPPKTAFALYFLDEALFYNTINIILYNYVYKNGIF